MYADRAEAGRRLAALLGRFKGREDVVVLGIPRGGVVVAFEIAEALHAPMDVLVVRKLGVPGHEELAFGAIASGGVTYLDSEAVEAIGLSKLEIERVLSNEMRELERRERTYRGGRAQPEIQGKTVILVDDGIATGSGMRAAVKALRQLDPARIVIAVPVAPASTIESLKSEADEFICPAIEESFYAIGQFYEDFAQVTDEEVIGSLDSTSRQIRDVSTGTVARAGHS